MSRKPLNKYTTTDVVKHGCALMNKNLRKTHGNALQKMKRTQELIQESMKYFLAQMNNRCELLKRCSLRSVDPTTRDQPLWKRHYKNYMLATQN